MAIEQKQLPNDTKILIVGLGLIGGSYAMALHRKGYHVEAIDRSDDTIDFALAHDYIDSGYTEPEPTSSFSRCIRTSCSTGCVKTKRHSAPASL